MYSLVTTAYVRSLTTICTDRSSFLQFTSDHTWNNYLQLEDSGTDRHKSRIVSLGGASEGRFKGAYFSFHTDTKGGSHMFVFVNSERLSLIVSEQDMESKRLRQITVKTGTK